jgi:hypothetical protein
MSKDEKETIKKELGKAILHLQKIIANYLEFDNHNGILAMKLVLLERKFLADFFKMAGNDAEFEAEGEDETVFHSPTPGKKGLLH